MVIGGHFGGGDHFDCGDHFGGGTGPRLANDIPQTNERFEEYIMPSDSRFTPRENRAVLYK